MKLDRNRLRRAFRWERVSPPARALVRWGLRLSCALLALSLLTAVYMGDPAPEKAELFLLSVELYKAPLGVLLLSSLGALVLDDLSKRQ